MHTLLLPPARLLAFSGFPFPITLTMWHMSFCSAVGFICVRVLGITKSHNLSLRDYTQRVLPIGEALPVAHMVMAVLTLQGMMSVVSHEGMLPLPLWLLRLWGAKRPMLPGGGACSHPHVCGSHLPACAQCWLACRCAARPSAGVLYAASLWLSNSAYLYLSVSFIQMTKSLMPGLVYACGVAWGTEQYQVRALRVLLLRLHGTLMQYAAANACSWRAWPACRALMQIFRLAQQPQPPLATLMLLQWSSAANMALIAFGVVVCALGEANLVMKGLVQQLVALLFEVGAGQGCPLRDCRVPAGCTRAPASRRAPFCRADLPGG